MEAKIYDTSAFGIPDHDHSKHRVYVDGLTFWQASLLQARMNLYLGAEPEFDVKIKKRKKKKRKKKKEKELKEFEDYFKNKLSLLEEFLEQHPLTPEEVFKLREDAKKKHEYGGEAI